MHWSSSLLAPSSSYIVYLDAPSQADALLWLSSPSSSSNSASVLPPIECSTTPVLVPAILPPASASPAAGRSSTPSTEGSSRVGGSYSFEYPSHPTLSPLRGSKSTSSALDLPPPLPHGLLPSPPLGHLLNARQDSPRGSTTAYPLARSVDKTHPTPISTSAAPNGPPPSRLPTTQTKRPRLPPPTTHPSTLKQSPRPSEGGVNNSTLDWLSLPQARDDHPTPADRTRPTTTRSSTDHERRPSFGLLFPSFPSNRFWPGEHRAEVDFPPEEEGQEEKEDDDDEGEADSALLEISKEDLPSSSDGEMDDPRERSRKREEEEVNGERSRRSTSRNPFIIPSPSPALARRPPFSKATAIPKQADQSKTTQGEEGYTNALTFDLDLMGQELGVEEEEGERGSWEGRSSGREEEDEPFNVSQSLSHAHHQPTLLDSSSHLTISTSSSSTSCGNTTSFLPTQAFSYPVSHPPPKALLRYLPTLLLSPLPLIYSSSAPSPINFLAVVTTLSLRSLTSKAGEFHTLGEIGLWDGSREGKLVCWGLEVASGWCGGSELRKGDVVLFSRIQVKPPRLPSPLPILVPTSTATFEVYYRTSPPLAHEREEEVESKRMELGFWKSDAGTRRVKGLVDWVLDGGVGAF